MASLRRRMAQFGFESNEDYDYQIRCLMAYPTQGLRCLNIEGPSNRRKSAFASALAHAIDYPHILYHDFSQNDEPPAKAPLPPPDPQQEGQDPSPVSAFDRAVSEACAFSEAEKTVLIIDQLQAADFRHHIRLYHFVRNAMWEYPLATLYANNKNFLLFLVSEEPLYHSLQKVSFRLWADGNKQLDYRPEDFDLEADAIPMMAALSALFKRLDASPTHSEYQYLLTDILQRVRVEDDLRHSIYAWTEAVSREDLFSAQLKPLVECAIEAIRDYIGHDKIELGTSD